MPERITVKATYRGLMSIKALSEGQQMAKLSKEWIATPGSLLRDLCNNEGNNEATRSEL